MASRAVKALASYMRGRKKNVESPYVLLLGGGASLTSGGSSFSKVIESVVNDYSVKDPGLMSEDDKVVEFYEILKSSSKNEQYTILKECIEGQQPSAGYHALAQLAKEGYFDVIFSTSYDTFVEDAFADAGLRSQDFILLINGQDTEEEIVEALKYRQPRIKLVKLHGDLGARIFDFTFEEIFQFSERIEKALTDYLSQDVIIVGHNVKDTDINRCIQEKGGSLWYVNPSAPKANDFIWQAMQVRGGRAIKGKDAYFDEFFCALRDELVGAPAAEAAVSRAAPETAAAPIVEPATPTSPTSTLAPAFSTVSDETLEIELAKVKGQVFDLERLAERQRVGYKIKDPVRLAEIQKELDRLGEKRSKLEEAVHLRKMLRTHKKHLERLEQEVAMYAGAAPLHMLNQMDSIKDEIARIEVELEELGA